MFSNVLQKYNKFTKYQNERVIFSPKTFFSCKDTDLMPFLSHIQLFLVPLPRLISKFLSSNQRIR